ncbi:hypothetical protein C1J00_06125 [Streptomyces cahuitamycinicus]|uniref:Uncharacterized protein n=1 Tax=Streptomyces cahuitamycinicus TaxID=2070367 RepID=A0A2N8TVJ4_9ACTN|nr:hypothetical protein C1J00_06125 [Streptomyces cahuitamycinicus]
MSRFESQLGLRQIFVSEMSCYLSGSQPELIHGAEIFDPDVASYGPTPLCILVSSLRLDRFDGCVRLLLHAACLPAGPKQAKRHTCHRDQRREYGSCPLIHPGIVSR